MDLKHVLAANLLRLRKMRGFTQEELAFRAGLSLRYVGSVERARVSPRIGVVGRLAEALGVEPDELLRR